MSNVPNVISDIVISDIVISDIVISDISIGKCMGIERYLTQNYEDSV